MFLRSLIIVVLLGVIVVLAGAVGWQRSIMASAALRHVETTLALQAQREQLAALESEAAATRRRSAEDAERIWGLALAEQRESARRELAAMAARLQAATRELEASLVERTHVHALLATAEERMTALRAEIERAGQEMVLLRAEIERLEMAGAGRGPAAAVDRGAETAAGGIEAPDPASASPAAKRSERSLKREARKPAPEPEAAFSSLP